MDAKRNKLFGISIFGHIKQNLPIDPIRGQYDIVFSNHQEVVINILQESIILEVVVESVKDEGAGGVVVKVLSDEVSLLELTYYVDGRVVNVYFRA